MTPLQISIVQQSWKQVFRIRDQAAGLFYQRLFELDPSVRALFTGDMTQQGRKLMDMIHVAVNGLNDLDALIPAVQGLGQRHTRYGVTAGHYATVGAALLWTLQKGLGDGFTHDIEEAWATTYGFLASTMTYAAEVPMPL
ncbi:MAG: globin domain-containing protein [Pseudomonadota bacterium]|nr:globin domain-containing protein [Pseudomonadota bacterium]